MKNLCLAACVFLNAFIFMGCNETPALEETSTLSGTAAVGAAIEGVVYAKGAAGTEVMVSSNASGQFSLNVNDLDAAIIVKVVPDDGSDTLYSFAVNKNQTVNVTPLTNLAASLAAGVNLDDVYDNWDGSGIHLKDIIEAQKILNANFYDELVAAGLDPETYDFLQTQFNADSTGIDAVLDGLTIIVASDGSITVSDDNNIEIEFDPYIDTNAISIGQSEDASSEETTAVIPAALFNNSAYLSFSALAEGSSYLQNQTVFAELFDPTNLLMTASGTQDTLAALTDAVFYQANSSRVIWFDDANNLSYTLVLNGENISYYEVANNKHADEVGYILYGKFNFGY